MSPELEGRLAALEIATALAVRLAIPAHSASAWPNAVEGMATALKLKLEEIQAPPLSSRAATDAAKETIDRILNRETLLRLP